MITTHVLDLTLGKPAAGIRVVLTRLDDGQRTPVGSGVTDSDGRLRDLVPKASGRDAGIFELSFETGTYFRAHGKEPFHPRILVIVEISDPEEDYHVPLLVSPYGYTTYRGS
jgi:5-hydroxyisourate hydrolase